MRGGFAMQGRRWFVGVVASVALITGACSTSSTDLSSAPSTKGGNAGGAQQPSRSSGIPTAIDGMFSSGGSLLTFKEGAWTRTLPDMAGIFSVSGDELVLSGQAGCPGDGTYTWSLAGEVITLTKVKETCPQRDGQFISEENWRAVHLFGESLRNGQTLLLADGQHVATYHGQLDVTGRTDVSMEASLSAKGGVVFSPTVLIGSPGQSITLTISNPRRDDTENVGHNFRIDELGIAAEVAYGQSAVVTLTFPQSGSLRFYCGYHAKVNQQGEILVQA
jgi:plastocyanin